MDPSDATAPSEAGAPGQPPELRAVLDAMIDHVAIGRPLRDASGAIVDFVVEYMNAASVDGAGRSRDELVGRRVCELYPEWRSSGLFDRFSAVVETGEPWLHDRHPYEGTTLEGTPIDGWWSLSVVPFGDGYLAASRDVTAIVAEEQARRAAEAAADANRLAVELLQRAALPSRLPEVEGLGLAARYRPAGTGQPVGGDWYDLFVLGAGRLGVVIADVAGHGEDAAALMVQLRNYVRALAVEHDEPAEVLARANRVVGAFDEGQLFATCLYGVVDLAGPSFAWASAGHLPPLLVDADPRFLEVVAGPPLGVQEGARFTPERAVLEPGDRVVLFTDGLVEERGVALDRSLEVLRARSAGWLGLGAEAVVAAAADAAPSADDDLAVVCVELLA